MRTIPCLLAFELLASAVSAQKLAVYDPFASTLTEVQPPTALLPLPPNPPIVTYPTFPLLPPPVPFVVVPGDSSFDNVGGSHWFTDGTVTLAELPSPTLGSGPALQYAIPPALLAALGGPITGIAYDPQTVPGFGNIMWTVSAPGFVIPVGALAGLPFVNPLPPYGFPIPFPLSAPITGLEWDGATSTLWAVDVTGVAYNFTPIGTPVGAPVLPATPMPGPAGDIAIDKIGTINAVGLRPLYVVAGPLVLDITNPAAVPFPAGPPGQGLAFLNTPAEVPPLPGCEGCPGTTPLGPTAFTTRPTTTGNATLRVGMGGLVPGVGFGIFAFDSVPSPLPFPFPNGPLACPLGLTLSPTLILAIGGPPDAAGNVFLPLPLTAVPVGALLHNQNLVFCPALPSGIAFSRLQTITCGGL